MVMKVSVGVGVCKFPKKGDAESADTVPQMEEIAAFISEDSMGKAIYDN